MSSSSQCCFNSHVAYSFEHNITYFLTLEERKTGHHPKTKSRRDRQTDLIEVAECLVQVGVHAGRRLVGDLDRRLQNSLRNYVRLDGRRRLGANEHSEIVAALHGRVFQLLLQCVQPTCHQVNILKST